MINKRFIALKLAWEPHACSMSDTRVAQFKQDCKVEAEDLLHFFDNFDHEILTEMVEDGTLDSLPLKDLVTAFQLYYRENRKDGKADKICKGKMFDNESIRPSGDMLLKIFAMSPVEFCNWFTDFLEMTK